MEPLKYLGSTSQFSRVGPGRIVKSPMEVWKGNPNHKKLEEENAAAIKTEAQILAKLGPHARIVPFVYSVPNDNVETWKLNFVDRSWGLHGAGILLSEASHGNLQAYLDSHNADLGAPLRWKWALQAAEAIAYLHEQGVIHSDQRPENYLLHATGGSGADSSPSLDLWLCDFGGSKCEELGLDGGHLPDDPFFDPRMPWVSTTATDIFSLGSMIYTILTGYWPYRKGSPPVTIEDKSAYEEEVTELFMAGKFPDVSGLCGGTVIEGCWDYQYKTAEEVVEALKSEMMALKYL